MATSRLVRVWLCSLAGAMLSLSGCVATPRGIPFSGMFKLGKPSLASKAGPRNRTKLENPVKLHTSYGRWQEQIGQTKEARESYKTVLSYNSKSVDAILGLARLDHLAGRIDKAEQGFLKALKLKPNDSNVLAAIGQFYAAEERWDEAIAKLNQAMLASPDDANFEYYLAIALARSGDIEKAMPYFVRSVGGEAEARYNVGYILYQQGKHDAAEQQLVQAIAIRPELAEAQNVLDEIHRERSGQQMLVTSPANKPPQIRLSGSVTSETAPTWPIQHVNGRMAPSKAKGYSPAKWEYSPDPQPVRASIQEAQTNLDRKPRFMNLHQVTQPSNSGPSQIRTISQQQLEQWQNQQGVNLSSER